MKSLREYTILTQHGAIHTLEAGSGVPVIFLHGWSVSAFTCLRILRVLSQRYRVIIPTIPGSTPSFKWEKNPSPEDFQEVLSEWMDKVNVKKPIVVGHSLGGVMAVLLTSAREKEVQKLILIDTVGVSENRHSKEWISAWLRKRVQTYKRYGVVNVARYIDQAFIKNVMFRTKDFWYLSKFARQVDVREKIKSFQIPVIIVWGEDDIFTPVSIAHGIKKVAPRVTIHTVPGNHDWPVFEPELLLKFL
ncbi:MAG: alpha/beta hydrolase [Patescibacteria group bacterium]|jgi:pimeloyl-ACP methyl ester carboxylesterase